MVILIILLVLLLIIFAVPYGIDAGYEEGVLRLGIKAGPLRIWLLPKKPLSPEKQTGRQKKTEKKSLKKQQKKSKKTDKKMNQEQTVAAKKKPDIKLLLTYARLGLKAVGRVFKSFSVDYIKLYYVAASDDPYDTAMQYSYLCAGLAALPEITGDIVRIRKKDIRIGMDFTEEKPAISGRIVISLQLYKIVVIAAALAVEYLQWKSAHPAAKTPVNERNGDHGGEQDKRTDGCNHEQDQTAC